MRRWDRLVERYIEEHRARGIGEATVAHAASRLNRWGGWLKEQRPRVMIEEIDLPLITSCAHASAERSRAARSTSASAPGANAAVSVFRSRHIACAIHSPRIWCAPASTS